MGAATQQLARPRSSHEGPKPVPGPGPHPGCEDLVATRTGPVHADGTQEDVAARRLLHALSRDGRVPGCRADHGSAGLLKGRIEVATGVLVRLRISAAAGWLVRAVAR
jgi:hypothetical protein